MHLQWTNKKIPRWAIWVGIYLLLFMARVGYLWYERSRPLALPPLRQIIQKNTDPDLLVVFPKFRVVDLEDARKLRGRTLWIKAGYRSLFFPCNPGGGWIRESNPLLLPPATAVLVREVFEIPRKGIYLSVEHLGNPYATQVALYEPKNMIYHFQIDDLFYPDDPFQFFPHWDSQVRSLVKSHQIRKEMTYAQAALALGAGQLLRIIDRETQVFQFPSRPGGQPGSTEVHFQNGKISSYQVFEEKTGKY